MMPTRFRIIVLGCVVFFLVSSNSLLHVNEVEFLCGKFGPLSAFQLSLFDTVLYMSYLLFGLFAGAMTVRAGRRRVFVLAGSLGAAVMLSIMPAVGCYPLLLLVRFFQGAFSVMAWQTAMTLILDYSGIENRGRNMGVFGLFMALAMGAGPMAGGWLAGISVNAPYYAAAAENVVACLLGVLYLVDPVLPVSRPGIRESFGLLRKVPALLVPSLVNFVDRLHMGFIVFILPLFVKEILGMGPQTRGLLMGLNAAAFILLQYPVGRLSDHWGRLRLLIPGSLGYALMLSVTGFIGQGGIVQLGVCFFVLGFFSGMTGPPNNALVGDLVDREQNPMAMAVFNLAGNIGIVIGPFIGGLAVAFIGFAGAFLVAGIIEILSLFVVVLSCRRLYAVRASGKI